MDKKKNKKHPIDRRTWIRTNQRLRLWTNGASLLIMTAGRCYVPPSLRSHLWVGLAQSYSLTLFPSVPKPRLFSYVNPRWCYFVTNSVLSCWKPQSSIVSQFTVKVQLYIFLLFKWMISWASLRPKDLRKSWQTIFLNSAILTAYKIGLTNELAVVSIVKVSVTWKFHS